MMLTRALKLNFANGQAR